MFTFLGIFIHLEKDNVSHTPGPEQHTCRNNLVIQIGTIIAVAETAPSGDRSIENYLLFA
jgi:hypothetical protein